jgi:hypothetical protein
MTNRAGISGGHEQLTHDWVDGPHLTRRAFGELVAGGLSAVGANAIIEGAR